MFSHVTLQLRPICKRPQVNERLTEGFSIVTMDCRTDPGKEMQAKQMEIVLEESIVECSCHAKGSD